MANFRGVLILVGCLLAACSSDNQPVKTAADAGQDAPAAENITAPSVSADNATATDMPPPHNYAMEEDGEYGYQPAISHDDENAGVRTKPLIMIRYLGKQNDEYTLSTINADGMTLNLSCADPCTYMKLSKYLNGQFIGKTNLENTPGSIGALAISDAMNGYLKPYPVH